PEYRLSGGERIGFQSGRRGNRHSSRQVGLCSPLPPEAFAERIGHLLTIRQGQLTGDVAEPDLAGVEEEGHPFLVPRTPFGNVGRYKRPAGAKEAPDLLEGAEVAADFLQGDEVEVGEDLGD